MNKKVLGIILIIVILLLVLAGYMMMKPKTTAEETTNPAGNTESTAETPKAAEPQSMKDLMTLGKSQKCTYNLDQENTLSSGSVYMDQGKVRADFAVTTDQTTVNSHMIFADNTSYIWSDGQTQGIKMKTDPAATTETAPKSSDNKSVDMNKKVDYKCANWSPDTSLFTLPTDVKFMEFSAPKAGTSPGAAGSNCGACNYLSGDQKTQCLKALNCE